MLRLREALEASWDIQAAYPVTEKAGNRAFGQCYPTARVVQHYYPLTEIIKGTVWTGQSEETHFWNALRIGEDWYHVDLSWQQFPRDRSFESSPCWIVQISGTVKRRSGVAPCC